jgi:hypothetical protein
MNKIRLTESQLHRVIKESVKKILKEEVCQVWSVYRGSGRPDKPVFEGSEEECDDFIDDNQNEYNNFGITSNVTRQNPYGDNIHEDDEGFLQWGFK